MRTRKDKIEFIKGLARGQRKLEELNEDYNTLKIITGELPYTSKYFRGQTEISHDEFARLNKLDTSKEIKVSFMTDEEYERYFPATAE